MAIDNRKTLVTNLPPNRGFNMTIYIPCFQLYPPPPPPPPPQTSTETDLSLLVTTMICIVGSLFLFLFLLALIHLFRVKQSGRSSAAEVTLGNTNRREDEDEAEERDDHHVWRINTSGLQRSVIDSITVVGFKKGQGTIKCTECSVCLNEFQEDESLRLLPKCSHAFHINCIDTWFQSHKNCPLCRAPVLLNEVSHKETETNHQSLESRSSNGGGEEESSGTRNVSVVLSRTQSDLVNNCGGSGSVETVRRSFSIGGSEVNRSRRHFYSSFSANFFSSSRRSRNQEPVLPTLMPSVSD